MSDRAFTNRDVKDEILNVGFFVFHTGVDCLQLRGLGVGVEADTSLAARDRHTDRTLVVWSGHLVRLGILPRHRLALADSGTSRPRRSAVIYSASGQRAHRYRA